MSTIRPKVSTIRRKVENSPKCWQFAQSGHPEYSSWLQSFETKQCMVQESPFSKTLKSFPFSKLEFFTLNICHSSPRLCGNACQNYNYNCRILTNSPHACWQCICSANFPGHNCRPLILMSELFNEWQPVSFAKLTLSLLQGDIPFCTFCTLTLLYINFTFF
jgi:hypothetical protein